jgi:hypothetical protein
MDAGTYAHIWRPVRIQENWLAGMWEGAAHRDLQDLQRRDPRAMRACQDQTAFDALLARYRSRLHAMELGSRGSGGEEGDAEMMLLAFKDIDSFGAKCTPGTWLYQHGLRAGFTQMTIPLGK